MAIATVDRKAPPRLESYEAQRASYRVEVPERFNAVVDIIERWAAEGPDEIALASLDGTGEVVAEQTVADLALQARRAARALIELGIQKGDPIFIMLPRVPAWYSAVLGAIRIGAVPMPGTSQLTSRDIAYRLRSADAVAAITGLSGMEKVEAIEDPPPSLVHRIVWQGGSRARRGWHDLEQLMVGRGRRCGAGVGDVPPGPDAPVLHEWHRQPPEDGPAPVLLRARPRLNRPLLARPAAG